MFTQIPLWIYLVVVLLPVSGFIAWAGDKIGHKVGKRRQSLFGLRPRHTATLFTIGAGVGISVVSFLIVWLSSAELRTVLSEGTRLFETNRHLKSENDQLASDIEAMRSTLRQAHSDAHLAIAARDKALQANQTIAQQGAKARADLSRARTDLGRAQAELTTARTAYNKAQQQVDVAHGEIADARAKLGDTRTRLTQAQADLLAAQTHLADAQKRYQQALRQVALADQGRKEAIEKEQTARAAAQDAEAEAKRITDTANELINRQNQQLQAQQTSYQEAMDKQRTRLADLTGEVQDLETKRDRLIQLLGQSLSVSSALRQSPITYQVGEEVDRLAIPSGISIWRVQSALDALMSSAGKKAQGRGAAALVGTGSGRAVIIPPRPIGEGTPEESPKGGADIPMATETDALRAAADAIRRGNEEVVVVLTAAANAVAGEPVPVELHTYRNPVVLKAGEKVGELTLESVESREQVADTLYAFLRRDVRKRLLAAGVIPLATGGNASSDENDERAGSIVSLTGNEWLKLMDSIRRSGPRSRVIVRAAQDLRAADPVRLDFEVKALSTSPPPVGPSSIARPITPGRATIP